MKRSAGRKAMQVAHFAGASAVVTGAASGIGKALAIELVARGATVLVADVDGAGAAAVAGDLEGPGHGPGSARPVALDVTDAGAVTRAIDRFAGDHGGLDFLFNNAGIGIGGEVREMTAAHWQRVIDVNLLGVVHGVAAAYPPMIEQGRGHIVNTASLAGLVPSPLLVPYSATKHAVVGLTEAIRGELRLMGAHIDVSYVMPYVVNTELGSGLGEARGMSNLEPSDVADAIVDALKTGRVDVWVPKEAKRNSVLGVLLPRTLAEGMTRAMKADRVLAGADLNRRRDYELRASHSDPGLEPPAETAQIAAGED